MRLLTAISMAIGICSATMVSAYDMDSDPFWARITTMMPPSNAEMIRSQIERVPEASRAMELRASVWQSLGRSELASAVTLQQQLMLDTVAGYKFVGAPCEGLARFDLWNRGEGPQTYKTSFVLSAFMDNLIWAKTFDASGERAEVASFILQAGTDRFRLKTLPDEAENACYIEKLEN